MKKQDYLKCIRILLQLAYVIFMLAVLFVFLEYSTIPLQESLWNHLISIEVKYIVLNLATLGVVFAFFWVITNRIWLAGLLCSVSLSAIAIINYYVIQFHTMPLSFLVLRNFTTAMNVISGYSFQLEERVVGILTGACILLLLCILISRLEKNQKISLRSALLRDGILVILSFLVMYGGYFGTNPVKPFQTITWTWTEAYYRYGYAACTIESFCQSVSVVSEPEGYSNAEVENIPIEKSVAQSERKTPDVVLILNESFYDLRQITDPQEDTPFLECIEGLDNALTGYAVVPGSGGGTNSSEYELLTSNSMQLMPGVTPFNSLDLENANSIVSHLTALGYRTLGAHDGPVSSYSRGIGYDALGFQETHFEPHFCKREYLNGGWFGSDSYHYRKMLQWYEDLPDDQPKFSYLLTIQNHGSWETTPPEVDTVHAKKDYGKYDSIVDEYLTRIDYSDMAFKELTEYFESSDRPVIVCMVGDHAPSFAAEIADPGYTEEERNLRLRSVPLIIWANFELEEKPLGLISMNYVVPTVLDLAGIELSPYYAYLLNMKENVPVTTAYGTYYDSEGNIYAYEADSGSKFEKLVDEYFFLEYHNIKSSKNRDLYMPY